MIEDIRKQVERLSEAHDKAIESEVSYLSMVEKALAAAIAQSDWRLVLEIKTIVGQLADQLSARHENPS